MTWLSKLERRFGRFAIPNLTFWIMIGQVLFFGLGLFTSFPVNALTLEPDAVLKGQVWRLFSFLFVPDIRHVTIWLIFGWILLFLYGNALEGAWGEFRFNLFVFIGVLATGIASLAGYLISGMAFATPNSFLLASIFLAFAILNPDFELLLFFVLPVKVKWLAWLTTALFSFYFIVGPIPLKLIILSAFINLLLFFGKDLLGKAKARKRRKTYEKTQTEHVGEAFHTCTVCGLTDLKDPEMDFVYEDGKGYCRDHVPN